MGTTAEAQSDCGAGVGRGDDGKVICDPSPTDRLEERYAADYRSLVRTAQYLVDDVQSAEEVVQEAFARVLLKMIGDPPEDLRAYLRSAVLNVARRKLRRRIVRPEREAAHQSRSFSPDPVGPEESVLLKERRAILRRELARLPRRQREVVALRFGAQLSLVEVAAALNLSISATKTHLSRGLERLRASTTLAQLDHRGDEGEGET